MHCMIYHQITQHIGAVATHSKEQTGNYQSSYLFVNAITKLLLGMKKHPRQKEEQWHVKQINRCAKPHRNRHMTQDYQEDAKSLCNIYRRISIIHLDFLNYFISEKFPLKNLYDLPINSSYFLYTTS